MSNVNDQTVGAIVAQNWKAAAVFQKYNIDFCCNGGVTLSAACAVGNVNESAVAAEISASLAESADPDLDYNLWELDRLAEHIENKHHKYVTDVMPHLLAHLNKICQVHGERHPELLEIRDLFREIAGELTVHMKKEEFMIFPFIKKMVWSKKQKQSVPLPTYGTIKNPISVMMHDHEQEGGKLRTIAELTNGYTIPADACGTYTLSISMLEEFEQDLHRHIHLENNILFPKAVLLEKELAEAVG
jgi:regulator of cell morphogenesis and NO signaling